MKNSDNSPDPTALTTAMGDRLRVELQRELQQLRDVMDTHFASDAKLYEQRFSAIQDQLSERDSRALSLSSLSSEAVSTALDAQKASVTAQNMSNSVAMAKSEAGAVKQLDGLNALLTSNVSALNDKIADLKSRLDQGEGTKKGSEDAAETGANWYGYLVGLIGVVLMIINVVLLYSKHP